MPDSICPLPHALGSVADQCVMKVLPLYLHQQAARVFDSNGQFKGLVFYSHVANPFIDGIPYNAVPSPSSNLHHPLSNSEASIPKRERSYGLDEGTESQGSKYRRTSS